MAQAYTPGLKVTPKTTHEVRRILPVPGEVLVSVGQRVNADDVVAQAFMPGEINPINLANMLSMPAADVPECMMKKEGDTVEVDEVIAETKGIFGMFKSSYKSRHAGTIETISGVTGQVILRGDPIPVQVSAYISGTVTKVIENEGCWIETDCAFIQGIFGIGGETHGPIIMACPSHEQELTADLIRPEMKDHVIVGGARATADAIDKARKVGAAAVVSGGIDDQDLKNFLGYDLGVAITGNEDVGLTVIITEGFGDIAMAQRTFMLLEQHTGEAASVNGATQIRAGVMRPEIIIPLGEGATADDEESGYMSGQLDIGRPVRIIRDPYFGLIGEVNNLPHEPAVLESGSRARVLEVKFESGETVTIPRANVELIEG